jgi:hypothetical protein
MPLESYVVEEKMGLGEVAVRSEVFVNAYRLGEAGWLVVLHFS